MIRNLIAVLCFSQIAAMAQLKQNTIQIIPDSTRSATGSLQFNGLAAGANHVGFQAPTSIPGNLLWTLPNADGSAGQCWATDGAGGIYFTACTGGSPGPFTAPFLIMTDYIFDEVNGTGVTGNLSVAGSNTITFNTTCPLGVNGTDSNHFVYIYSGTGTAEAARITGGSCTSGAAGPLTITLTTLNTHTSTWHVTTATAGLQEAFQFGSGSGRYIWASGGNYNLWAPFNTGGQNGICIVGAGIGSTNFVVSSFYNTVYGVFAYNFSTGGCMRDFTLTLTQPDSTNIADYTQWPPAMYIVGTQDIDITNVEINGAWNALLVRASGLIRMTNIQGNAFNHFLDNDNGANTLDINGMSITSEGLTSNQATVFTTEPTIYAAYMGYQSDGKIKNLSTNAAKCANFHQGTSNAYSSFGAGLDGFYGIDNWECDIPGFEVDGEAIRASNMWFTSSGEASPQITQTGGSLQLINSHFYGSPGSANPDISLDFQRDVNDGFGAPPTFMMTNSILEIASDSPFVTATFTSYAGIPIVSLQGNQFQRVPQSTWSNALIQQTAGSGGGSLLMNVTNNYVTDKTAGTGTFISLANDYTHVVTGNTAVGWSYSIAGNNNTVMWGNPGLLLPTNFTQGPIVLPFAASDVQMENTDGVMTVSNSLSDKSVIRVKNANTGGFSALEFHSSGASSVGLVGYGNSTSVYPSKFVVGTNAGGADVLMYSGGNSSFKFNTDGLMLGGLTTTDYSIGAGSFISNGAIASATAVSNASLGAFMTIAGSYLSINSTRTGGGTYLPIQFLTSDLERVRITTGGVVLSGLTTTDLSLTAGAIVSSNSFVSVTNTSDATCGSFQAVSGLYLAIASCKTGVATYLPIAFFTSGSRRWDINTSGSLIPGAHIAYNIGSSGAKVAGYFGDTVDANFIQVNSGFTLASGVNIVPAVTGTSSLGSASLRFDSLETGSLNRYSSGALSIYGVTTMEATLTTRNVAPSTTALYTLGDATHEYLVSYTRVLIASVGINAGQIIAGLASTDLSITSGAIVSGSTFASVTATTNASVGSLAAIAGSYVALGSGRSGSGTYLPLAFFTSGTRRWDIDTSGHFLPFATATYNIGGTSQRVLNVFTGGMNILSSVTVNGSAGITGSTCSSFRFGICIAP